MYRCEYKTTIDLFPHSAPVSKHKEMSSRLGLTISYKSLSFVVHPSFFSGQTNKRQQNERKRVSYESVEILGFYEELILLILLLLLLSLLLLLLLLLQLLLFIITIF